MRLFVLMVLCAALAAGCAGQSPASVDSRGVERSAQPLGEGSADPDHLALGETALKDGQLSVAAREYRLAAEASADPQIAERATVLALTVDEPEQALLSARRWYALSPGQEAPARRYAILLMNAGDTRKAVSVLRNLKAIDEATGEAHSAAMLLSVALEARDSDKALKVMQRVLGKRPQDAAASVVLSSLSLVAGKDDAAEKYARAALAAEPQWSGAVMQLARVLVGTGRAEEGLALAGKYVAAGADLSARLEFASLLNQTGDYSGAGLILEQVLLEYPGFQPALRMMGYIEYQAHRPDSARRYYSRLAAGGYYTGEAYYYLGQIALDEGDGESAASLFKLVPESDYFLAAQFGVRDALILADKPEAAMKYLGQVALEHPEFQAQMLIGQAELQLQLGRLSEATGLYRQALKIAPHNIQLRYGLAMALEQDGQVEQALDMLRWIVKREPGDATALNALGFTLADHKQDLRHAYRYIRKAYKLEPDNPAIVDSMGWVEYRRGNNGLALKYLRRALALMQDPEIAAHLGEVLWVAGERDEARSVWEQAQKLAPEHAGLRSVMERFEQ